MTHTFQWLFENCRGGWWKHALLGGTIALAPALALAADKDKDKEKSNKHSEAMSSRRSDSPGAARTPTPTITRQTFNVPQDIQPDIKPRGGQDKMFPKTNELKLNNGSSQLPSQLGGNATPMSARGATNKNEADRNHSNNRNSDESNRKTQDIQPDIKPRGGQDKIFPKTNELKLNNGPSQLPSQLSGNATPMSAKGATNKNEADRNHSNNRNADESNRRTFKADDMKGLDRLPDAIGKKNFNGTDLKNLSPYTESKNLGERGGRKSVKPDDLKNSTSIPELPKPADRAGKNSPKSGDLKFGKSDFKLNKDELRLGRVNLKHDDDKKAGSFLDLHKAGKFDGIVKGPVAKKLDLGKQFELKHKGDLTLKLNLAQKVKMHGGWSKAHWAGLIGPGFGFGCSPIVYCGPGYFPSHCLWPGWSPWVKFCWDFHCDPICDPRPWFCRPWIYEPCPVWVSWDYPVWYEMPVVVCGTWVDVEPVVIDDGLDLQLLAVRFVDPGQPELREGPRYRVWARNNSARTVIGNFNVLLMAANTREAVAGLPQAGVRVDSMAPGEIKAFDIRLPFEATTMGRDAEGLPIPFSQLHAIVDSHREIPEVFEENNGGVIARADILPVDPVIFGTDSVAAVPGTELNIAGEGFGPEPGQVLVHVGGIELQAEIEGWYDLGVRVRVPPLALAGPTDAEVMLIRGDTAASNPLTIQLTMPVASR